MKETHHIVPVFYKNTISRGERKSKKPEKLDDAEMEQNHKKKRKCRYQIVVK